MANEGLLAGLQNLPIFNGVPGKERDRALLQAGLGLLQPQDPLQGGGALTQLSGGVQAGLQSLDQQEAKRLAAEQQAFANDLALRAADVQDRGAAVDERGVGVQEAGVPIAQQGADAATKNADTGAKKVPILQQNANTATTQAKTASAVAEGQLTLGQDQLDQRTQEFNALGLQREADLALTQAETRYKDRLPAGSDLLSNTNASSILKEQAAIKRAVLLAEDQSLPPAKQRYSRLGLNDPRLNDAAWSAVVLRDNTSGTQGIAFAANGLRDATGVGQNVAAIADPTLQQTPPPALPVKTTPADDAKADAFMRLSDKVFIDKIANKEPELLRLFGLFSGLQDRAILLLSPPTQ